MKVRKKLVRKTKDECYLNCERSKCICRTCTNEKCLKGRYQKTYMCFRKSSCARYLDWIKVIKMCEAAWFFHEKENEKYIKNLTKLRKAGV